MTRDTGGGAGRPPAGTTAVGASRVDRLDRELRRMALLHRRDLLRRVARRRAPA